MNTPRRSLINLATLLTIGAALPQVASAVSFTWTGSANTTWDTTSTNWKDGVTDPTVWLNAAGASANDAAFVAPSSVTVGSTVISVRNISSAGNTLISSGTIRLDSASSTNTGGGNAGPLLSTSSGVLTVSSVLTGTRGLGVSNGTVVLSGVNTYTGNTLISGGTLRLGITNALPTATSLITFGSNRIFDLGGFSQTVASIQGSNGVIQNSGTSTSTLTINGSANTTSGQAIRNATNLVRAGTGTTTLLASQGPLNYTGSTTISSGSLLLSTSAAGLVGTSAVSIEGGSLISGNAAGTLALGLGNVTMSAGSINPGTVGATGGFSLAANRDFITTGGTINIDLNTTGALDQFFGSGTGTFSLTDTTIALNLISWTPADYSETYAIFSGFSGGSIANLSITGYDTANYTASLSNTGVLSFTAVPEPTVAGLLGATALSLALVRRRRSA
jgi:fibronectin-binding autotransporter adhesin